MPNTKKIPLNQLVKPSFSFNKDTIPTEMQAYDQWVTWSLVQHPAEEKPKKLPVQIIRENTNLQALPLKWGDPDNLMSFGKAFKAYQDHPDLIAGIGFVFSDLDPFVFIDLDGCYPLNPNDEAKVRADNYINKAKGTFIEFSQSNKGVHIIVEGHINKQETTSDVEIYHKGRFVALTGKLVPGGESEVLHNQNLIDTILTDLDIDIGIDYEESNRFQVPEVILSGERNDTLYKACWSLYGKGLRDEELEEAYAEIVNRCEDIIPPGDKAWSFPDRVAEEYEVVARRKQIKAEQMGLADRYCYIPELNKYFDFKYISLYSTESLNKIHLRTHPGRDGVPKAATYIDVHPNKTLCKGIIWMPCSYGKEQKIVHHDGNQYANTWAGFQVDPIPGNISPWLKVMEHLYPDQTDREWVIKRMSFDVQHPDKKCNWHIVNYGIEGAGKDLALYPLSRIFGEAFSAIGNEEVKSQYDDGFVKRKIIEVNEVNGLSHNSLEKVKQKCTSEGSPWMQLNPKSEAKITVPNLFSLYFNTNHSDAMHIRSTERRFFILRCDTPMTERFTSEEIGEIADWIKKDDLSPNHIMHHLLHLDLSDFDPGVVPYKTKAFHEMCEIVMSDRDETLNDWADLGNKSLKYDFVTDEMLLSDLHLEGIRVNSQQVKTWLSKAGYYKVSSFVLPQKFGHKMKSRRYYTKKNLTGVKPAELWEMIEAEEITRDGEDLEL